MSAQERASSRERRSDPFSALGFRRIECVRLSAHGGHPRAAVTGVVHRYPRTVRVPLAVAARLVACGVPLVVERVPAGKA